MSDAVSFTFANGEAGPVPGAYLEFAQRLPLPEFAHLQVMPEPLGDAISLYGGMQGYALAA